MGAVPWGNYVPFEANVEAALEKLKRQVFASGEYFRSELKPTSELEALQNTNEDGTASALDMMGGVSDSPEMFCVSPLPPEKLESLYGTTQPTHEMVESNHGYYEDMERGQGIYIIIYKEGVPHEYLFAGYSFD